MSVLDQIKALDEQKAQLLAAAKDEALTKAKEAIAALNELGFNYRLVEGTAAAKPTGTGRRRSGIRAEVLDALKASPQGMPRAMLLEEMGVKGDKSGEQSVSNALSALKKSGEITNDEGVYKAA